MNNPVITEKEREERGRVIKQALAPNTGKLKLELTNFLKELKKQRSQYSLLKDEYDRKTKEFNERNKTAVEAINTLGNQISKFEEDIRSTALRIYEYDKEKKLVGGVGIRVREKLEYAEESALIWAKEHELALKLDKKAFEGIAKNTDISFVKKGEEPYATIPTNIEIGEE